MTSLIRNAPGPLRGARALAADLMEGLIDVISPPPEVAPPPPPPVTSDRPIDAPRGVAKADRGRDGKSRDGAFGKATSKEDWVKRQDFKVLAILWEARRRDQGPITAKSVTALGKEIGLTIRHENVRKVVRTRLKDKVETTTIPNSQPPTFVYHLLDAGAAHFEDEYLAKA